MKKKPDVSSFLAGGSAAAAEQPTAAPAPAPMAEPKRMTKTIRLRLDLESRLKDEAYERTKAEGRRVTESDLIEQALCKYFNM